MYDMTKKKKDFTQTALFAAELLSIAEDVTEKDRKDYMAAYQRGATTVSNYLNGKVSNADTAAEMLVFFRRQIEERNKLISIK